MQKTRMSITRALVELKRYDQKIAQALQTGNFVARTVGRSEKRKVPFSTASVSDVAKEITASYDKVNQLIKNRAAVKAAIVLSNANTKVKLLSTEMSVAEAIELKSSVAHRTQFLQTLRQQLASTRQVVDSDNAKLQAKVDASLNAIYSTEKSKATPEMVAAVTNPQLDMYECALLDPADIAGKIEKLVAEVNEITSELDFTLSEINAKTEIEIEV